jgi:hypothetical protein
MRNQGRQTNNIGGTYLLYRGNFKVDFGALQLKSRIQLLGYGIICKLSVGTIIAAGRIIIGGEKSLVEGTDQTLEGSGIQAAAEGHGRAGRTALDERLQQTNDCTHTTQCHTRAQSNNLKICNPHGKFASVGLRRETQSINRFQIVREDYLRRCLLCCFVYL